MTTLTDLITRLEQATGPDKEIDYAIGRYLWDRGIDPWKCFSYGGIENPALPFTGSVDVALTLVRGKVPWVVIHLRDGRGCAEVESSWQYDGATPAIALCIAALKAMEATS